MQQESNGGRKGADIMRNCSIQTCWKICLQSTWVNRTNCAPSSSSMANDHAINRHRARSKKGVGLAGNIVDDVSKGLGGKYNPVGAIVHTVAKGLKRGAGEA
jgi:hypothetical protein